MGIRSFIKSKVLGIKESNINDVLGIPVDYNLLGLNYNYYLPVYNRDLYPDRSTSLRTQIQYDKVSNYCRLMYEINPSAQAVIHGLRNYVIGAGLNLKVESTEKDKNNRLVKQVEKLLEDFCAENNLDDLEDDVYVRYERDGEVFLRIFPQDEEAQLRMIEPNFIRAPHAESHDGLWSFGILTKSNDFDTPEAYNVCYRAGNEEVVPAHFIYHLKNNVARNVKRGVPTIYSCINELDGSFRLRDAILQGEKVRNCIAYVRQFALATKSAVEQMNEVNKTDTITRFNQTGDIASARDVQVKKVEPGMVVDIPKGMEFQNPPTSPGTEFGLEIITASLNVVAACFGVPSWIVTGQADGMSYASSVTAESPFIKTVIRKQRIMKKFWLNVFKDVIEIEEAKGNLPEDTLDKVNLLITYPSPVGRSTKEGVEAQLLLVDSKAMSISTLQALNNLDADEEENKIRVEMADPLYAAPPMIKPILPDAHQPNGTGVETSPPTNVAPSA